ncbi:hypothetical protein Xcel_2831 [Xylanimonas cellulosilytica DSM 15894]|uniref:Peptidase C60 sortase A and B n=1 Tax=Xylanimonas cellulosilytica (strain DSM 15894 / JCM 12276 / CECT 5975 / KCTC 9989 / LMG 20990 / NBRC 107835 / XIL07) TaxID=446471 RepID=D1BYH3_XYLCX|nr:hypothetical protein [Xylanimonas cellulosilytica]ACZ31845.1 hypothetical protein Xcel_2831 [Xylanimonas cellulosilytica DSM 15894]
MTATRNRPARRGSTFGRAVTLVFALACLAGAGVLLYLALRPAADGGLRDMDGNAVVLDEEPDVAAADPVPLPEGPDGAGRFLAPAQELDVPLLEMNIVRGVVNPPSLTDAFLLRGFGTPDEPGSGLVIVTMHAVRGGNAPGNVFFRMEATDSPVTVAEGDPLVVDGVEYVVVRSEVMSKDAASSSADIWGDVAERDGELVLITCLQRAGATGVAADNLIVFAQRVD